MKIFYISIFCILYSSLQTLGQQFAIDTTLSDQEVISKFLGPGIQVTQYKIWGGQFSRGAYTMDTTNFGFKLDTGIVIMTGNIKDVTQPNYNRTDTYTEFELDPFVKQFYLDSISNDSLSDVIIGDLAMIEFDFTTNRNKIKFNFIFASEEYPVYVCSDVNDSFGFLLSEVTEEGNLINTKNLAKLPNGSPISINTVNNGEPGDLADTNVICNLNNIEYFVSNFSGENNFVFNGYTTLIPIEANIIPDKKYNIKFFVADIGDRVYNSAVFIDAQSFATVDTVISSCFDCISSFSPAPGEKYLLSAWVKEDYLKQPPGTYSQSGIRISFNDETVMLPLMRPEGSIIDGWQRIEHSFIVPLTATNLQVKLVNEKPQGGLVYFDDIRIHPFTSNMKSFVYDPSTQLLTAELDENNYSTRYEYDDEGILIRVKKETERGIMTIKETRNNQSRISSK